MAGRRDEARRALEIRPKSSVPALQSWTGHLMAWLERRPAGMIFGVSPLNALKIQDDPEAIFQVGWQLCDIGDYERGLDLIRRAVAKGYAVAPTLSSSSQFDALRNDPAFQAILAQAEASRRDALAAFREAGGEQLLGF
jgi:hypothetical protein